MQPTIGIVMCQDDGVKIAKGVRFNLVRREYGERVRAAGGQPIYLDSNIDAARAARLCDGIVISGGEDIDPQLYGGRYVKGQLLEPVERSNWERKLIDACDAKGIPILGICYGQQLLNVHYGGTLVEEISEEYGAQTPHSGGRKGAITLPVEHNVSFGRSFLGFHKGDSLAVNSRHHQAVARLAPGFKVAASAPDGVVEAISGRGHYGVQWHAETGGGAEKIYSNFVRKCNRPIFPRAWAKSWQRMRANPLPVRKSKLKPQTPERD